MNVVEGFKMKRVLIMLLSGILALNLTACQNSADESASQTGVTSSETVDSSSENTAAPEIAISQTGFTTAVPDEYKKTAAQQGEVVELEYDSLDYLRDSAPIFRPL